MQFRLHEVVRLKDTKKQNIILLRLWFDFYSAR